MKVQMPVAPLVLLLHEHPAPWSSRPTMNGRSVVISDAEGHWVMTTTATRGIGEGIVEAVNAVAEARKQ